MVKTSFITHNQQFSLQLPKSFVGKRVEILAYTQEEVLEENQDQNPVFNFNTIKVLTNGLNFNRNEANER